MPSFISAMSAIVVIGAALIAWGGNLITDRVLVALTSSAIAIALAGAAISSF